MEYLARKRMKKENEICHETFIEMFNAVQSYYRAKITFVCINVFCHQGGRSCTNIFGQEKCLFGSKTVFLGQEVHYYIVYIAYFTELILQICDYAQKQRI